MMSQRMKILLVIEDPVSLDYAPSSRVYYVGNILSKLGIGSIVIPLEDKLHEFLKGKSRVKKNMRRVYLFFCMMSIVRKEKINFIFTRGFCICLEALILAKVLGIKIIYDFHGYVYKEEIHRGHHLRPLFTKSIENICIKFSDIIVTQKKANRERIQSLNRNILVLENGVCLEEFDNLRPQKSTLTEFMIPDSKPIVGFVGHWENWMRIEDLLMGSRYLKEVSVVVVGKGKNYDYYRDQFKNVYFVGQIPHREALALILNFDICVSPYSKDEIMAFKSSRKTLEYMAAGKALLVSDVAGREDYLKEGINCLFYRPEDPKDLANKIEILLNDYSLRKTMGQNNRALAQNFSWENKIIESGLLDVIQSSYQ